MRPDEIKRYIQANFKNIMARPRSNPDRWAFFYAEVRRGPRSTRIARALDDRHGGTRFKLSVTSRLTDRNVVCKLTSEEQLREQVLRIKSNDELDQIFAEEATLRAAST